MDNEVQQAGDGITRRGIIKVGGISAFALLLAACGSEGPRGVQSPLVSGEPVKGGDLAFAMSLDISTLDPAFSTNFGERFVYYTIYDTLVAYDKDFNIVPSLAKSWDLEKTALTLHLRDDVLFHDGTPFNAKAAKWNIDRILDPGTNSPNRGLLTPPLAGATVVDEFTLRLDLEKQWRPVLAALGERPGFMVSPTAAGKDPKAFASNPVGTGPFKFVSYAQGSELKVVRNEDYWDAGNIHLDSISFKHVTEENQRVTMIRTGEAHATQDITPQVAQTVANDTKVVVEKSVSGKWNAIQMDVNHAPFDKKEVRQAVAHATNRAGVQKALYLDQAALAAGPVGTGWAHDPNRTPMFDYDLEKARDLIKKAGAEGVEVTWANSAASDYQSIAQLVQEDIEQIGLNLNTRTVPDNTWYDDVIADKVNFAVIDWTPRADVDGLLRILFHSQGGQNSTGYNNPEVDKLLDEAATILDPAKAKPLYDQITKIIEEDAPYSWIVNPSYLFPRGADVGGLQIYPDGIIRIKELWLNK